MYAKCMQTVVAVRGRVFRRGETWSFVVDLPPAPDGRRRQRKKGGFRTKKDASRPWLSSSPMSRRARWSSPPGRPLADYLEDWLAAARPALRPTTAES